MEFRFNLNELFKEPIVEIGNSLIPPGFTGDKRALWDTQSKITQIVNAMGEASAHAQGLSKPITTADRLRNSEHKLYLLFDQSANSGRGAVTGMLKTGEKGLYVFDREGQHYKVSPSCVLDFYIHESRQRAGYGKGLFQHMLQKQQVEPVKMAIDRPSDKLLGFLNKHYGLNSPVKQMNNYVVYDGFFPRSADAPAALEADKSHSLGKKQSANGLQHGIPSSPYGRYGAPRPTCSMGQIIHNDSAVIQRNQEPTGVRSEPLTNAQGQHNMYYSNQMPAWQATQSVPNMHYSYPQNQQNYAQFTQQYASNQQYSQYQQFDQNQNAQYQASSGDNAINAASHQMGQPIAQNQAYLAQNLDQNNKNAIQNNQQPCFNNYAMGQGDATNQSYNDQNVKTSTTEQAQGKIANQTHQHVSNPNEAQGDQAHLNQSINQGQPQVFTYQGQTYCYNPQTQQYYIIPNQNQPNYISNDPQNQQVYYNQLPMQVNTQQSAQTSQPYSQQIVTQPHKEPLRPQNLDGTVRRVQQSASMPVQKSGIQGNQPLMIHEAASAPVSYHYQSAMASQPYNSGQDQTYSTASLPQGLNQNQSGNQVTSQMVGQIVSQPQLYDQNQSIDPISHYVQGGDQNFGVNQTANSEISAQAPTNVPQMMTHAPQTMAQNPQTTLAAHNMVVAPEVNTPINSNASQMIAQAPSVIQAVNNQMPTQLNQSVHQGSSVPNVQQQNTAYAQMTLQNQANFHMAHQNQPSSQMAHHPHSDDQNSDVNQLLTSENLPPAVETTHSRIHNVSPQQKPASVPNTNQRMEQSISANQPQTNQITMAEGQKIHVQQQQTQQQMMHQHQYQHLDYQLQNSTNQEILMSSNQNKTAVAKQQPLGAHRFDQKRSKLPQNIDPNGNARSSAAQERHVRADKEVDLSKGYPPQHHERPAQNSTPKADRPQSLNIETTDIEKKNNHQHEDKAEKHDADAESHEPLDGNYEGADSFNGEEDIETIEEYFEKIEVALNETTPLSKGSRSPVIEAAGIVTPGRNTPGLTDQGYFDLKFYHNKLW